MRRCYGCHNISRKSIPHLLEEKRRDLAFGSQSFCLSILPSHYRSRYLVGVNPPTVLYPFFRNFTCVLVMVWRYACGLDIIFRLFFVTFFASWAKPFFRALSITKWMDRGYLVSVTPPTVFYWFFGNFTGVLVVVWRYACGLDIISDNFCHFFRKLSLGIFRALSLTVNGQGIPCGHNFFYGFIPNLSKLHWCFGDGLKICMWFGYNRQFIFCYFFRKLNLVIFQALYIP